MPEGDTVWLAAARMHEALAGRRLTRADLRVPQLATTDLAGQFVTQVLARGKHMLTRLDGGLTLRTHFRMDGKWVIAAVTARPPGPDHQIRTVLANETWCAYGFLLHDIALVPTVEETRLVGHLGPDLLGPDWDADEAVGRLHAQPGRAIGEALQDQRNLAGIGNLYANEVLFLRGRTPWTPVSDAGNLNALVTTAHRLLRANRDRPEQSTTGDLRRGRQHWVYLRAGQPCLRCRTRIRTARLGQPPRDRAAFWCPFCQRGPSP
jgi:endonuclease-8